MAGCASGGFDIGLPAWGILLQPLGFVLFFAAAFAETKRAPFDAPEGESEIIGYFVEYSGMKFGLFMISEFVEVVVLSGVIAALFFGGYHLPFGGEWLSQPERSSRAARWLYGTRAGHRVLDEGDAPVLGAAGHPLDVPALPLRPDPDAGLEDPAARSAS